MVSGLFQKKHDLLCNVYQACVLLLFNWDSPYFPDGRHRRPYQEKNEGAGAQDQPGGAEQKREDPKLTLSQMVEILGLDEPTVKKMLGSFFLGRFKIIKKVSLLGSRSEGEFFIAMRGLAQHRAGRGRGSPALSFWLFLFLICTDVNGGRASGTAGPCCR